MKSQTRLLRLIRILSMGWLLMACGMVGTSTPSGSAADATPDAITSQPAATLEDTTWVLVNYGSADKRMPALKETQVTLSFAADGKLSGSAGCNSYAGSYTRNGQSFKAGELIRTERGCADVAPQEQENVYLAALQAATALQQAGDALVIDYPGGQLVFAKQVASAAPALTETVWQLDSFVTGETARSVVAGSAITAQFVDGKLSGSAGCNQFSASYTLAGDALTVSPVVTTKMACDAPLLAQEQEFVTSLGAATNLRIENNLLHLVHPGGTLVWRAQS